MNKFVVIKVIQNYDDIDIADCLCFNDENSAKKYVTESQQHQHELVQKRRDYIRNFVDSIELPADTTIYKSNSGPFGPIEGAQEPKTEWADFIRKYNVHLRWGINLTPEQFKDRLCWELFKPGFKIEGCNPPKADDIYIQYFVREIEG